MKLKPEALATQLRKQLTPVYLVSGDEPLQQLEAADAIRSAARDQGFAARTLFEVNQYFDWDSLLAEGNALSLFAERRLIELRIPSGKLGRDGGAALVEWFDNPPEDTLLLILLPKLDPPQRNTKWFKLIDAQGVVIQVWPVTGSALPQWLRQRARQHGLLLDDAAVQLLVQHTEGNLLAAAQELEKLRLIDGEGKVSAQRIAAVVAGNSRHTPFDMVDTALQGEAAHALHMLAVLRAEDVAIPLLLWSLAKDVRLLVELAEAMQRGQSTQKIFDQQRVWEQRRGLLGAAVRRHPLAVWRHLLLLVARIDNAAKGGQEDPWLLIEELLASIAGYPLDAVS